MGIRVEKGEGGGGDFLNRWVFMLHCKVGRDSALPPRSPISSNRSHQLRNTEIQTPANRSRRTWAAPKPAHPWCAHHCRSTQSVRLGVLQGSVLGPPPTNCPLRTWAVPKPAHPWCAHHCRSTQSVRLGVLQGSVLGPPPYKLSSENLSGAQASTSTATAPTRLVSV